MTDTIKWGDRTITGDTRQHMTRYALNDGWMLFVERNNYGFSASAENGDDMLESPQPHMTPQGAVDGLRALARGLLDA